MIRSMRVREEQLGLSLIEVIMALLLLSVGALTTLKVIDTATASNYRAEQSQVVNDVLQAELERIKQLPYAQVALTANPGSSSDPNDPRSRVQGSSFAIERDGSNAQPMVINGSGVPGGGTVADGVLSAAAQPFTSGDVSGETYRFVTWTTDPGCPLCGTGLIRRVVVAARVLSPSGERAFQEVHTDVVDPEATPEDNPAPPDNPVDTAKAAFWLTDTPCSASSRQPIVADHLAHNTRGGCSDGPKTGGTRGAPDLMFTKAPTLDTNYPPEGQPLYDYDTDVSGSPQPIGLTMPWASSDSCLLQPVFGLLNIHKAVEGLLGPLVSSAAPQPLDGLLDLGGGDSNKHHRVHSWLSPPVTGGGGVLLGKGTLDLYSKTVNGAVHPGEICVTLFVRQTVQVPVCPLLGLCLPGTIQNVSLSADIPFVNVGLMTNQDGTQCQQGLNVTYFRCSRNPWPADWTKISVPLNFAAVNAAGAVIPAALPANSRIGLSVAVKRSGTEPGQGLEFMYDAVGFESRLELESQAVISF